MRDLLFIVLVGGLVSVGCGDDSSMTVDGGTDTGPAPDATTDTGSPGDSGTPDGTADTGTPIGPGEGFARGRAALDRVTEANCECAYMMRGFDSAAECVAFDTIEELGTCEEMAYAESMSEASSWFDCNARVLESFAACIEAAACEDSELMDCGDEAATLEMRLMCGMDPMAYIDALRTCVDTMVIGEDASMCPENAMASMATGDAVFMGTTLLGGDDNLSACGGEGAPDRIFEWTAPAAGTYVFDTIGSGFDTILHLFTACPPATFLGCDDDIEDGIDQASSVSVTVTDGQSVFVSIDGFGGSAGNFQININAAP